MRIVGSRWVADVPGAGNQCRRIFVPSNEERSQSLATPAIFVTTGFAIAGGVHFAGVVVVGLLLGAVVDGAPGAPDFAEEEHAASAPTRVLASSTLPITRAQGDIRTSNEVPGGVEATADPTFRGAAGVKEGVEQTAAEFETWVAPHLVAMARLARRLVGDADRDDVVQDALTRAWQKSHTFDPSRGSERVWLLAIVADRARRARRGRRESVALLDQTDAVAAESGIDVDLERAVASLPKRMRLAVECVYFVDLSIRDTAELMQVAEGTIKSTLHDARALLRRRLEVSP
jgi:RNA polymerase sigma-70 factor (ECF subfamily)